MSKPSEEGAEHDDADERWVQARRSVSASPVPITMKGNPHPGFAPSSMELLWQSKDFRDE
jgi:hypothetical protein